LKVCYVIYHIFSDLYAILYDCKILIKILGYIGYILHVPKTTKYAPLGMV